MGELEFLEKIKRFIGNCGWKVFLWSRNWTEKQYICEIKKEMIIGMGGK